MRMRIGGADRTQVRHVGRAALRALTHPAALFSAGNTALITGQAGPEALVLSVMLTVALFAARFAEDLTGHTLGVPLTVLAVVNLASSASMVYQSQSLPAVLSALTLSTGALGHLLAARTERKQLQPSMFAADPQFHYGIANMLGVCSAGTLNPVALLLMTIGTMVSVLARDVATRMPALRLATAPRIYAAAFVAGAAASTATPGLLLAQILWALAYLGFRTTPPPAQPANQKGRNLTGATDPDSSQCCGELR